MRNDDANDQHMSLNHNHPFEGADTHDDALLASEFGPEHEALVALAAKWSATTSSAERLAAFTRQLPLQEPAPQSVPSVPLVERMRSRAQREANIPPATRHGGRGRMLATIAAAVIIVGLLATALLRFAPNRTGQHKQKQLPAATATATPLTARQTEEPTKPLTARQTEEPTNGAFTGKWTTVDQAQLIPAPSDGNIVYRTDGSSAQVSHDGGATWSAITLPSYTQKVVLSQNIGALRVSDQNAQVVLLSITLMTGSTPASDCPAGSKWPAPSGTALHGGIDASGASYCFANFASHDGGATWANMTVPTNITYPPAAYDPGRIWQVGNDLFGVDSVLIGSVRLTGMSLLVSHDLGVTWTYVISTSPETSAFLCSVVPSPSEGALYVDTNPANCYGGASAADPFTVWRSVDGGVTWRRVSTVTVGELLLFGATPATNHGAWLYGLEVPKDFSQPVTIVVSADGGVTWSEAPALPSGASTLTSIWPLKGTLSDGSLVIQDTQSVQNATQAADQHPKRAMSFLVWRPGDAQWRTLATPIFMHDTMLVNAAPAVILTRGGADGIDTLWVSDEVWQNPPGQSPTSVTTFKWSIP